MDQEIKNIDIKNLVLWTENPRDSIDENASDQDIVDKAIGDQNAKWTLKKLVNEMGPRYDFSELPTVVIQRDKPIVYDGNRRIILGKIKHGFVNVPEGYISKIPEFPREIPCNVCKKTVALENVYRKHIDTGSWQPLERDIFLNKFMGKEKSTFLILNEETNIIDSCPHLNQRFVKDEIFREDTLKLLGFSLQNGHLFSNHSDDEAKEILNDISKKILQKAISTRKNRGKVIEVLDPLSQEIIERNKKNKFTVSKISFKTSRENKIKKPKQSIRTKKNKPEIFGEKLFLDYGSVSNLYRDIVDLYSFFISNEEKLSKSFVALIRMSLRLICETASNDKTRMKPENYINKYFDEAKQRLDKDSKTTLSAHSITKKNMIQLLHIGAHNYSVSQNLEQTLALSIILGSMLTISHGKEQHIE